MKSLFQSICVLASLCGLCACQRSRAPSPPKAVPLRADGVVELNLMSFNVRYESPEDHDTRSWRKRITGAVRMIRKQQPDCIGVQEALHGQAADLWASLPDYEFFGVGRDDGKDHGEYSGIFYARERFRRDFTDCGTFWLSDTPERAGSKTWGNEIPRVAAWLRLVDLATGRGFYIFNTHWDHKHQESRERAAMLISQRIDGRKHADEPVALMGDFNSMESNPGVVYLTGRRAQLAGSKQIWPNGLLDSFQVLHAGEKNRRTLHFWNDRREGPLKVDHILVSRSAKIEAAEIVSGDIPMISDHYPVTARVKFPLTR